MQNAEYQIFKTANIIKLLEDLNCDVRSDLILIDN